MNEGIHLDLDTWIVPGQIRKANSRLLCTQVLGQLTLSVVIFISSFPILLVFAVGGLGSEFCVFIVGRRHALRSEWPFIIILR